MSSAIAIKCKKSPLQWLITQQPYCIVNSVNKVELKWGKETEVPLEPNLPYQIRVEFPYMGKPCMPANIVVNLKDGERHEYLYSTASNLTVFSDGKMKRTR